MNAGPRDVDSILDSRYWLTEKGIAATDELRGETEVWRPATERERLAWLASGVPVGAHYRIVSGVGLQVQVSR